jgi:hypothetical protein
MIASSRPAAPRSAAAAAVRAGSPYFDTNHAAGLLFLIIVLAWGAMELAEFSQGLSARQGAAGVRRSGPGVGKLGGDGWCDAAAACSPPAAHPCRGDRPADHCW